VRTFGDIYGHEKRISLALEGRWGEIVVGRDHLAPVEAVEPSSLVSTGSVARSPRNKQPTVVDLVGNALRSGF
jgi:hypothetical protein